MVLEVVLEGGARGYFWGSFVSSFQQVFWGSFVYILFGQPCKTTFPEFVDKLKIQVGLCIPEVTL